MTNILKTIKIEGASGVIIWGKSSEFKTESQCQNFKSYFENDLIKSFQDFRKIRS